VGNEFTQTMVTGIVVELPFLSVTLTIYVPANNPDTVAEVCTGDDKNTINLISI
jgi:hypothetical protein